MLRDLMVVAEADGWMSNGLPLPEEAETHLKGVLQKEDARTGVIEASDLTALDSPSATPNASQLVKRLGGCDVLASEQKVRELIARGLLARLDHKVDPEEILRLGER